MLRNFSVSFVLGLLTFAVGSDANAGWGSSGGSYGGGSSGGSWGGSYGSSGGYVDSYGSHGSWGGYGSNGGSWGSSHGGWGHRRHGLLARLFGHHHHRQSAYASHGSWGGGYGGSNGSWGGGSSGGSWGGSSGGSWGGHGSSGGSWGGSYGSVGYGSGEVIDGTIIESTPAAPTAPAVPSEQMESEPMPPAPEEARSTLRKGILVVSVPDDAQVVVNGEPTRSTGQRRRYVSHGLKSGESYRYVVKAVADRNGKPTEQTKVAVLRAGKVTSLDFDFNGQSVVETSLTLNVPEDAKVYLSGHETKTQGDQRRFSTTRIEQGEKWADYLVRVTVDRAGRSLTQERRVTLNGGDQAELNFEFADAELAAAR
jgi:uncharacterized protein (TIGR03000 family)